MLRIGWEPPEIPDFAPEIHNPEKVFAFLCYRGIHYAKWVYLDVFNVKSWNLNNPRKEGCHPLFLCYTIFVGRNMGVTE